MRKNRKDPLSKTHVTVQATRVLYDWIGHSHWSIPHRRACDWESVSKVEARRYFDALDVYHLLDGSPVDLPTCPMCSVLSDLALQLREESKHDRR